MMQEIDQAYVDSILRLPDGRARIFRWVASLIDERCQADEVAQSMAQVNRALRTASATVLADLRAGRQPDTDALARALGEGAV